MKKLIYLLTLSVSLFALTSCSDFLNEVPKSSLTPENSFTTSTDWEMTLTSCYAMLQEVFVQKYPIVLGSFGTDEVEPFDLSWAAYAELKNYTYSASHEFFRVHYIYCYDGIKRCNTVIDMPASAPVSNEERTLMTAQARFLRSIFYFDLVRMYGGVPLWTSSAVDKGQIAKPRATADEVYQLVVDDMKYAAENLPETWTESTDKGRATKYAAYALLGREYLQWGKPNEALENLNQVIGKYHLYKNYSDIFDPAHKNEGYENIFEVQFSYSGYWGLEGSLQSSYWGPRGVGGPTNGGGWGGFGPTQYLYDSYEAGDLRKEAFFYTEFKGVKQTPPSTKKYVDKNYGTEIEDDDLNYILIRYPDVLLMKAEALNDIGDSSNDKYECINEVRRRAGIKDITAADNLSKDAFADKVLEERLHELCCEHHRRFDLIRFGKLISQVKLVYGITIGENQLLYPIPQAAIDNNDAITENNPGY
jgi:SusD family.